MSTKSKTFNPEWADPDDAPAFTKDWFESAEYRVSGREVSQEEGITALRAQVKRGRPVGSFKPDAKQQTAIRFDRDVLAALKATGKGWQTRVNEMVRKQLLGA